MRRWKILSWLGFKKKTVPHFDVGGDLRTTIQFIEFIQKKLPHIRKQCIELRHISEERKIIDEQLLRDNIYHQLKVLDKLLLDYQLFEEDTIINGKRLKLVMEHVVRQARKHHVKELDEFVNKRQWRFNWA